MDVFDIKRKQINTREQKRVIECLNNPKIDHSGFITYLEKLKFEEQESIYDYIKRQPKSEQDEFEDFFKSLAISQSDSIILDNKRQKI